MTVAMAMFLSVSLGITPSLEGDYARRGAELTKAFYAKEFDSIWDQMGAPIRRALGSQEALRIAHSEVLGHLGREVDVLSETVSEDRELRTYKRSALFDIYPAPVRVQWTFSEDGRVEGFLITPDPDSTGANKADYFADYQTRTNLYLPIASEFSVYWGGRQWKDNYHAAYANQRYAYDFLVLKNGASHAGTGALNADYYCFGMPLISPAAGILVKVVDGVRDNQPGQRNVSSPLGNHIVIDHGNGEFSLLAHMREGSILVSEGQRVAQGALLGECGNSGSSSEPHLHYQLQNAADFWSAFSVPAQFVNFVCDGEIVARGEPRKGQRISPMTLSR